MGSPSSSLSTLRPDLASFLQYELESDRAGYVASRVFPIVNVASQSGNFGKIPLSELLDERDTKRNPGSGYARGNFTFTPATYSCEEHGAEEPVDDRESKMYGNYFDHEVVATARAFGAVLRNAEKRVADSVFNTTTWTGASLTTAVSTPWSTVATATPIADINSAVNKVYDGSGLWPNALIVNRKVFRHLRRCAEVIDKLEGAGAGNRAAQGDITAQMLADVFDLDMVIVAGASRNSAIEGQTVTPSQIWSSSYAMVCKVATSMDMREPCIGRCFHWSEDGSQIGGAVETYREEKIRGDVVRVRHDVDEIVLYSAAGHLLSSIT